MRTVISADVKQFYRFHDVCYITYIFIHQQVIESSKKRHYTQ